MTFMNLKKDPKSDIETTKTSLLLIGLIIAFSISLLAFGWISVSKKKTLIVDKSSNLKDEELFDVNVTLPPPPPPPPPAPAVLENINIKTNDDPIEETQINADVAEDVAPAPMMEDFGTGDEIFDVVEENPSFPGGIDKFRNFLGSNIIYPRMARDLGVQGRVVVQFVVEKDGSVTDIVVVRSLGNGTDEEAIRVLQKSPKWNPGKQQGKAVRVKYTVPIVFSLKN